MPRLKKAYILFIAALFIMAGCFTYTNNIENINVAFLYNPQVSPLHPEYTVYHGKDSTSQLYFNLPISELLFSKLVNESISTAKLKIKYELYAYEESNKMTDSASMTYIINRNADQKSFTNYLTINAKKGNKYTAVVTTTDLTRTTKSVKYFVIDKTSVNTRQNFLVADSAGNPVFRNYFSDSTIVYLRYNNPVNDSLFVLYYKEEAPMPAPPFSLKTTKSINMKPDSTWRLANNESNGFLLQKQGLYHIQVDTMSKEGISLFNFGANFPRFNTPANLLLPIRYLTPRKDYEKLQMFAEKKYAVDNFWLECSGNINRAKELIKVFYNRATFANLYFTSHTEGWKTDRGMIYIIYGAPNTIYKTNNSEQWLYGDNITIPAMNFNFYKVTNAFSDNNYVLNRNEEFAKSWYQAVDTWRNGRVFSISQ